MSATKDQVKFSVVSAIKTNERVQLKLSPAEMSAKYIKKEDHSKPNAHISGSQFDMLKRKR